MSPWIAWTAEAFAQAKKQRKPILAAAGSAPPESLKSAEVEIAANFVAVLADPETRPDAAARLGGAAVVLDLEGARRAVVSTPSELAASAKAASSPRPAEEASPVWTGAVREGAVASGPDASAIAGALDALHAAEPTLEAVEALLHLAGERGDVKALASLGKALEVRSAGWDAARRGFLSGGGSALTLHARWAAIYWDSHALTGEPKWKDAAGAATEHLLRELWDPAAGAFRRAPAPEKAVFPADGNAFAAIALFRAHAFGHPRAGEAAQKVLGFLQSRLYDPILGLVHAAGGEGESVSGLLGDAASATLAFTDGFLATGIKAHREFADALIRFLFQELWEREAGGFLDRVARKDDPLILREPRVDPALNALALEACRRMHHLKGNHNYRRWVEWGLKGAWPKGGDAGLARVADLHARGRMDFELVGRPGEAKADALLAAVHRLYLPRKVISFVDPDDQDYILAHKLEADAYPRLFGCGADLRKIADAADAAGVAAVAAALRGTL